MCKTECLLTLIAVSIGLANSWDIAITSGDQIEFYSNNTKINESERFKDLTALAYDAVHNMLLFVDKQNDNASIFSFHLATKKYQSLVRRRSYENIQGLAFDPVTSSLFWTDVYERSIYWISLKPGSKNDVYGNLLIKMDDELPRAIAVDSCRGYIYWTNTNITKPSIERAKLDGSERQIVVNTDIFMPVSIAVDQRTKRLYWADDKEGIHYSIESSNLEGKDRKTILQGTYHQPNTLTVSKDSIYWVDWGFRSVWELPKDAEPSTEPTVILEFSNEVPFGIVANYPISDQIGASSECQAVKTLSQNESAINDFNIPKDVGLFCLHGVREEGKLGCKCSPGYVGDRCEISVCYNFCIHGECTINSEEKPMCRCKSGYSGPRCEINICEGFCLNNGVCSVKGGIPSCHCEKAYEGSRCETLTRYNTLIGSANVIPMPVKEPCNCTNEPLAASSKSYIEDNTSGDFLPALCDETWDAVRDNAIIVLGVICGLLCLCCTYLITKVLQLKKRPRIKKRIIVNKNVTPMTARPDQCEITIENCCNMNICETPCFEPRSAIRPTLGSSKPGKEEKSNLIANMEYPEDY